jgi:integral membrane protein (TIGR01906 family)
MMPVLLLTVIPLVLRPRRYFARRSRSIRAAARLIHNQPFDCRIALPFNAADHGLWRESALAHRWQGVVAKVVAVLFIVSIPVFLITSNVRFLVSDVGFYRNGLREYRAEETTGIALPELDRAAQEIIDYFENDAKTLRIVVQDGGQEEPLFNAQETQHMEDVKQLIRFVFRLNEVALAIILAYISCMVLWTRGKGVRRLARESIIGVAAGFVLIGVVGALALTGFDSTWNRLHRIVFRNDLWQLDPDTDHLIQMFPEPFWKNATYLVGALTLLEAVVIVVTAATYLWFSRSPGHARRRTVAEHAGPTPQPAATPE